MMTNPPRAGRFGRFALIVGTLLIGLVVSTIPAGASPESESGDTGRRTIRGEIDGAKFRIEMPERWNGTLVLYSHGYYPPPYGPPDVLVANREDINEWMVDHGYAVAASWYKEVHGFSVEHALKDQIALLDWFDKNIGKPRRTISSGMSMGGGIAVELAERNPRRFAGVMATCSDFDQHGVWNTGLDVNFVSKTLLAPNDDTIELVRAKDPEVSRDNLIGHMLQARTDANGRARLALAAAMANITPWYTAHEPRPVTVEGKLFQQSEWATWAFTYGLGPFGRADIERRAGGNPFWNTGIDYRRQLERSSQKALV